MDIVDFETYAPKWSYFTLIFFFGLIYGAQAIVGTPLLSSNSLNKKFGETVPILYTRDFISFRIYLDVAVTRAVIYAHFVSSPQVAPYPFDRLIMWFSMILL